MLNNYSGLSHPSRLYQMLEINKPYILAHIKCRQFHFYLAVKSPIPNRTSLRVFFSDTVTWEISFPYNIKGIFSI